VKKEQRKNKTIVKEGKEERKKKKGKVGWHTEQYLLHSPRRQFLQPEKTVSLCMFLYAPQHSKMDYMLGDLPSYG
jgi:hypothetical protein